MEDIEKCNEERVYESYYDIGKCFLPKGHNGDHMCIHNWTNWDDK